MRSGAALVLAHLKAFEHTCADPFDDQLTADFVYRYLPPVLGSGPILARRWRKILHRVYRSWCCEISEIDQAGDDVLVRARWTGADPVEPDVTPAEFVDTCLFRFEMREGRLSACDALYLDHDDRAPFSDISRPA